jgi:hypothetical protein
MSAVALITGVPMASMSQLRAWAVRASANVTPRTTTLATTAPAPDTMISCSTSIVCSPNSPDAPHARAAVATAVISESSSAASTFAAVKLPRRRLVVNWPVSMPVPSRAASAPKIAPRMPIADGTSTSRPGVSSSTPSMAPRMMPANSVTVTQIVSADTPWRSVARSFDQCASTRRTAGPSGGRRLTGPQSRGGAVARRRGVACGYAPGRLDDHA